MNQELREKRKEEELQRIVKEQLEASREKDQLGRIQNMMGEMTKNLEKNSQLLNKSLQVQHQYLERSKVSQTPQV